MRVFVDTCVWRHWFVYRIDRARLSEALQAESNSFSEIYNCVTLSLGKSRFLYNARIRAELGERFEQSFEQLVDPYAVKVPIPLTRMDGSYSLDGSFIFGGRMGGSLRALLEDSGYQQERAVAHAAESLQPGEALYDAAPRRREFDVEHMESALEAKADLFLTVDTRTILSPLQRTAANSAAGSPLQIMLNIAKTPREALHSWRAGA